LKESEVIEKLEGFLDTCPKIEMMSTYHLSMMVIGFLKRSSLMFPPFIEKQTDNKLRLVQEWEEE
jgi:hypothetical protein